jgi:hypothetical protein
VRAGELGVEVERILGERQRREEAVVAFVERAAPVVFENATRLELFVWIALGTILRLPHRPGFAHAAAPNDTRPSWIAETGRNVAARQYNAAHAGAPHSFQRCGER